jgi:hypothetical protein
MLNRDQILSAVRSILIALFTFAVAKDWISADTAVNLGALVVPIGIAIWGLFDKTKAATVAKAADIVPIPKAAQIAAGVPPEKVVTVPTNPKV